MPSILEREILQQPEVVRAFLQHQTKNAREIARELRGRFNYMLSASWALSYSIFSKCGISQRSSVL